MTILQTFVPPASGAPTYTSYNSATLPASAAEETIITFNDPKFPRIFNMVYRGGRWLPLDGSVAIWQQAYGRPGAPGLSLSAAGEFNLTNYPTIPANWFKSNDLLEIYGIFRKGTAGSGTAIDIRLGSDLAVHSNNSSIYNINVNGTNNPQDIVATPFLLFDTNASCIDLRTSYLGGTGIQNGFVAQASMTNSAPQHFSFHATSVGASQTLDFYGGFVRWVPSRLAA